MARKALRVLLPASVAVLVASQWREIARYLKYLGMCITALAAIAAVTGRFLVLPS